MRFLANYWWLLILPFAIFVWIRSVRATSGSQWVWILRLAGLLLLVVPGVWLVTGDVENRYVSIHMGPSWTTAIAPMLFGVFAFLLAHRLATKRPPA